MDKPMLVFKRFGHQIHLMVQKEAKRCGIEFMGGPQGQVVRFLRLTIRPIIPKINATMAMNNDR